MQVKYQEIRGNREYEIFGVNAYQYYPRMIVRVLDQPPPYSNAGNFYPSFRVRILRIVGPPKGGVDPLYGNSIARDTQPGSTLTIYWRNNSWGDPWSDIGLSWRFFNAALEPLPTDLANKTKALQELKAIPSIQTRDFNFPGGTDFLALSARQNADDLDGGQTFFHPVYLK